MKVTNSLDLAVIIRDRRNELKMTQEELARKAAVSRSFVIQIEKSKPSAQFGTILKILRALELEFKVGDIWKVDVDFDLDNP